ncbi:MAG TPA: hypothetical protein VF365_13360 [Candidatus Limnocylindria bacterium]
MRQRFRPLRARVMARRPGEDGRFTLTPRERRLLGWIVAAVIVIGIAIVVGILGGNADGSPVDPDDSTPPSAASALAIAFGTELDQATWQVAAGAGTDRFVEGDLFAYSVPPTATLPATVHVEVVRTGGGAEEVVQPASPDGDQPMPAGRPAIAFSVPAANLFRDFGPGEYRMRIFADPAAEPLAEGSFILVGDIAPASTTPSSSP